MATSTGKHLIYTGGTNERFRIDDNVSCAGTLQTGGNLGVGGAAAYNGTNLAIEKYLRIELQLTTHLKH